jgi:hypothetical protein
MKTEIVTKEDINNVFGCSNFGEYLNNNKIEIIKDSLLKIAGGYRTGHTATMICFHLGLLTKSKTSLSKKGKYNLYCLFKDSLKTTNKSEISSCARILEENTGPENVHVNSVINKLKELSKSHD